VSRIAVILWASKEALPTPKKPSGPTSTWKNSTARSFSYPPPSQPGGQQMMSHEKLDVYQASIEFFAVALKIRDDVPRGHGDLLDQFQSIHQ
jgi:hypothetical protein